MENVEIVTIQDIEVANIRPGDHVICTRTKEYGGLLITERREGEAFKRNGEGEWRTREGGLITDSKAPNSQIRVRRPIRKPPSENGSVIIAADLRIEAVVNDRVWTTLEAVCGPHGVYWGVWRSGKDVRTFVCVPDIQPGTWRLYELSEEIRS